MNSLLTVATLGAAVAAINLGAQEPPVPLDILENGDAYSSVCDVVISGAPAVKVGDNVQILLPEGPVVFGPDPVDSDCTQYDMIGHPTLT